MRQQAGILGYPLSHSISPAFQQAAFDHYSLPVRYNAWPTPPEDLAASVERLRGPEYLGANLTVPHKEAVLTLLDHVDGWARSIGAVNTIVRREDGSLEGHNTDADGFIRALRLKGGFEPAGARVLLLGAGGSARAAAFCLARVGIAKLTIANRTAERGRSLADDLSGQIVSIEAVGLARDSLAEVSKDAQLIVNCTSVGMNGGGSEGQTPLPAALIPSDGLVYDIVYNPPETKLLADATRAGARTLGGLPMLVYQGARSFEIWTGEAAPIDVMFEAAERALDELAAR